MAFYRCGSRYGCRVTEGVLNTIKASTDYVIDTGLPNIQEFRLYGYNNDSDGYNMQFANYYNADNPTQYMGVNHTMPESNVGGAGRQTLGTAINKRCYTIKSVVGGIVTITTPSMSDVYSNNTLMWTASESNASSTILRVRETDSGIITNVTHDTDYVINTGLDFITKFCAYQIIMSGTGNDNQMSVYDSVDPDYYVRAQYLSGVTQTVARTAVGTTAASNNIGIWIMSISGGTITVHTGKRNANINKRDIRWFAT